MFGETAIVAPGARHVGFELFDYVLVNTRPLDSGVAEHYASRGSVPVIGDGRATLGMPVSIVKRDLNAQLTLGKIRHAPDPLARAILELACAGRPSLGA